MLLFRQRSPTIQSVDAMPVAVLLLRDIAIIIFAIIIATPARGDDYSPFDAVTEASGDLLQKKHRIPLPPPPGVKNLGQLPHQDIEIRHYFITDYLVAQSPNTAQ